MACCRLSPKAGSARSSALDPPAAAACSWRSWPPGMGVRLQHAVANGESMLVVRGPRHLLGSAAALVVSVRRVRARWIGAPRPLRLGGLVSEARVVRSRSDPGLTRPGRAWLL